MSEQKPESDKQIRHEETVESDERSIDLSKSLTGSAQMIDLEPGEGYEPPTMALDSIEPESDE